MCLMHDVLTSIVNFESSQEQQRPEPVWVLPDFTSEQERGELERVCRTFAPENQQALEDLFYSRLTSLEVTTLTEEMLSELDNTNARDIGEDNFEQVDSTLALNAEGEPEKIRDWRGLKRKMEQNQELDMPVLVKVVNQEGKPMLHTMSGNTRLMVARALGIMPQVAIIDLIKNDEG